MKIRLATHIQFSQVALRAVSRTETRRPLRNLDIGQLLSFERVALDKARQRAPLVRNSSV